MLSNDELIVYEVNLVIQKAVYEKNKDWLLKHFEDMVTENNFIKANIFDQICVDPSDDSHMRCHKLTAQYFMHSYGEMEKYFEKMARAMRSQVVEKLGDHYTVNRRVFSLKKEILLKGK